MKKTIRRAVSILLVLTLVMGISFSTVSAEQSFGKRLGSAALGGIVTGLLSGINAIFPDGKDFVKEKDYQNDTFYEGSGFVDEASDDARWKLGYANASLVPADILTHGYYLGGYIMLENFFSNKIDTVIDDMKVRTVALDDGSGRGITVFAVVDCIGMTNNDIKEIRKAVEAKSGGAYEFAAINVSSTHAHSCIDTEGLWTNMLAKALGNIPKALTRLGTLQTGTDPDYMQFLYEKAASAIIEACDNMTTGTMTVSQKVIGDNDANENGKNDYFNNKNRSSASALMTEMTVLKFIPDDESQTPTMIVNIAAHPDVAGLPTDFAIGDDAVNTGRQLSGEYVYYMGETLAEAGYNCLFVQGAIAGIYMSRDVTNDGDTGKYRAGQSARYGRELARMALAINMTYDEIVNCEDENLKRILYDECEAEAEGNNNYTRWYYEDWEAAEAVEVEPLLNMVITTVAVPVTNPLIQLAGKLNLASYDVVVTGFKKYAINVEIGYVEFGHQLKAVMMPGEICQDLVAGGSSLTAEDSYSGKAFEYPCIREMFGDESIICFGLCNDAIGYVVPDNDYCMAIAFDHYQEIISLGKHAGSTIMEGFEAIADEVGVKEVMR